MRQQQAQPFRGGGGVRANEEAIGRIREITDQGTIEIRALVYAGRRRNDVGIKRRSLGRQYLGRDTRSCRRAWRASARVCAAEMIADGGNGAYSDPQPTFLRMGLPVEGVRGATTSG